MNKPKAIVFDLGGVIINVKTDKEWFEENLLQAFHPEPLEKLFLENYFKQFETGHVKVPEFLRTMKSIAREEEILIDDVIRHWNGILKDIPEERVELLKRLKDNYHLILFSNTNKIHVEAIRQYMDEKFGEDILKKNFHDVYFSYDIGVRKPHKEVGEWILQKHHLQPADVLFLDDRPENLVEPGKMGMPTLLVDREVTTLLADY